MYSSSYSPIESNAVVPSPLSSFSPLGRHPRSPSADFLCEPGPKRSCREPASISGLPFEYVQSTPDTSPIGSQTSPPPYNFGGSKTTAAAYQQSDFCDFFEDSKTGLAYLQGAMQPPQQRQMRPMATGQTSLSATTSARQEDYTMVIHKEPEQYYRARYETEGIRGPLKGLDNSHPAVRIIGPPTYSGTVRVTLVHDDGTKHTSCFLDESKDRQKALLKKIDPNSNMIVEFEDLRIRRETKSKNYNKEGGARKADKTKNARNDKTARLLFIATLQLTPGHEIELRVLSNPIQLCAPPEGAELEWLIPEYGHTNGEEKIVIKGTKMTCPKVTFTILLPEGHQLELPGHVDKEQSHQNVLVVKTPRLPDELRNYQGSNHCFKAEVRVSSGRAGTCSAPLPFCYIPNSMCHTCKQPLPPSMPVHQTPPIIPFFPPQCTFTAPAISGVSFAGCSTPSPQSQSGNISLSPFQPQVSYAPRLPQMSSPAALSHPPPSVSSPSAIPTTSSSSSQKDNFQGIFCSSNTQSPTLTPTSSPGPVNNSSPYWDVDITPTLPPIPVSISQSQDIGSLIPSEFPTVSTSASMQLVTSPGSETVYSAAPSPDTTSIFPPYSYMDNSNAPYNQFTS